MLKSSITKTQRQALRNALEDRGVPEVYAFMAAELQTTLYDPERLKKMTAAQLIISSFIWQSTPQGQEFWNAIYLNA